MAAPPTKTLRNLNGQWVMNKSLSDSPEPALVIQGIGWVIRKGISLASVSLVIKQYEGEAKEPNKIVPGAPKVTYIDITQTASGLSSTQENRCLDGTYRSHSDWLFGDVKGKSEWSKVETIQDEYLRSGWEAEKDDLLILSDVQSKDKGWKAEQVWGFQVVNGTRRHCRHIVVTKGKDRYAFRMVYDFIGENEEKEEYNPEDAL